jgi:hypothetical protein
MIVDLGQFLDFFCIRTYRVNSKYVTILKPQDLQEMNKPKMWLNI